MKKIAKLSLVAAVAVVGFTSANAQALEEAIKNVDVSGSVVYRYDDKSVKNDATSTDNNYKVALNLSSKVNDDVKFNSRFLAANSDMDERKNYGGFAGPGSTQSESDSNVDLTLSHAYFGYTGLANTTINAGKQGLTTPWTVAIDSDGAEQTGTGVLAMTTVGPVTFAGAYFNQTNLDKSGDHVGTLNVLNQKSTNVGASDIATVGAIANLDFITLDAWYLDLSNVFDSYTVGAQANFDLAPVKLGVDTRYTSVNPDAAAMDNHEMAKIALTAKAGIVSAKLAYAWTGKDGGFTAIDTDANTTIQGWSVNANNKTDADFWQAVVGVDLLSNLNLSANYVSVDYVNGANDLKEEEIYAQLTYKMSQNLSSYARFGTQEDKNKTLNTKTETDYKGRLQVEYTF
ncbi:MAG: major outer membrane protein [Aliarcobacter sp.]|nr:major outer membrane protein [Aliarcobacter sp.]